MHSPFLYSVTICLHTAIMQEGGTRVRNCLQLVILLAQLYILHISRTYRVTKNQLDAQLILSIFRQSLHVSGVSRPIIRRYNWMYTTVIQKEQ
jgi:hypothetical protein